jgi:hypothetical protein
VATVLSIGAVAGVGFGARTLLSLGGSYPILWGLLILFFLNTMVGGIRMIISGKRSKLTLFLMMGLMAALFGVGWNVLSDGDDKSTPAGSQASGDREDSPLARVAEKQSKTLPRMLDGDTRWDTIVAGPGEKLTYSYTLVNLALADIDREALATKLSELKKTACIPAIAKEMLSRGLIIHYKLQSKDRKPAGSLELSASNCK